MLWVPGRVSKKPAGRLGDLSRAAQVNPCPPQYLSLAVPRAAEDHPLPLCCGPARSRLKWRQPPCPSKAETPACLCPAVQGLRVGAWAWLREAGCPAGSQHLFGRGCCGPRSNLRSDRGSPHLAALLRPVLSPPGQTGCRWETLTHF